MLRNPSGGASLESRPAMLVREPGNQYNRNVIAVHEPNAGLMGYVNKRNVAHPAKRMDAGEEHVAILT